MKKIIRTILCTLLLLLSVQSISAAGEHVIFDDYSGFLSKSQYDFLNDDLAQVEKNYDVGIYFVFDQSIEDTESGISRYASNFISSHSNASNNVVLVVGNTKYKIEASGDCRSDILSNETVIWDQFYKQASGSSSDAFYDGIVSYYQNVLKLINNASNTNTTTVDNSSLVHDLSGLMSSSEVEKLNSKLQNIKNRYGFDTVILTTDTYNGKSMRDYCDDFYDYNGFGNDGLLLMLNMKDRGYYFSTKGKAIEYFSDYGTQKIFDKMVDDINSGNYYDAFDTYADEVEQYIKNGNAGNIIDVDNQDVKKQSFGFNNVIISAVIAALATLITNLVLQGQLKSVRKERYATNYVVGNSFRLIGSSDMFVNRRVSRVRRPRNDDSSRGGGSRPGGTHVHTSSSGSFHGGHGGHF